MKRTANIKPKKVISSDLAKEIGQLLPQGSKERIAIELKVRPNYVRGVLTGNYDKPLTTAIQFRIIELAVEMLQKESISKKKKLKTALVAEIKLQKTIQLILTQIA